MGYDAKDLRERLAAGEAVDFRGDGKAGGGLVLVVQAFGAAIATNPDLDVQDWPLFSSARKGANVRAYVRVARGQVQAACQVTSPNVALLMNEAAAETVDFADGTTGGIYVLNTSLSPAEAAKKYRLGGTVATVAGDELGQKHLGRPLGNVAMLAALVKATELITNEAALESLLGGMKKRRIPARLIDQNRALFLDAIDRVRMETFPADVATDHRRPAWAGYGELPAGAQAALRTSKKNRTSGYGRPGVHVEFREDAKKCNGCSLCVIACPEGIIEFTPDPAKGAIVHGARFADFCKVCRECIAACPLDLFHEVESVTRGEGALAGA